MASFITKTDRKQVSIILNLIKLDCSELYKKFHYKKQQLKQAIEKYEEFMTIEINNIFNTNNNFSGIVISHRCNFQKFLSELFKDDTDEQTNGFTDETVYALCISLQEWLLQGAKGQQFYFLMSIDAFNLTKQMELLRNSRTNGSKMVSVLIRSNLVYQTSGLQKFILLFP